MSETTKLGPLTYVQHEGEQPPVGVEASRLPGNYYDSEGRRIGLFGTAYAQLFAAAPELLELLKMAHERFICGDSESCIVGCEVAAAIAKAETR
jgi:hypothetical protein